MPRWGTSNEYPQHTFSLRNKKNINWIPPLTKTYENVSVVNKGQDKTGHVQDDLNLCILRVFEDTFSLDVDHIIIWRKIYLTKVLHRLCNSWFIPIIEYINIPLKKSASFIVRLIVSGKCIQEMTKHFSKITWYYRIWEICGHMNWNYD